MTVIGMTDAGASAAIATASKYASGTMSAALVK
jgi:hypothetical protein